MPRPEALRELTHLSRQRGCKADAGLNAIPLLEEYRAAPEGNVHLLLTGLGAVAGQLPNIDLHGQPSMAFHGDPSLMRHDPYRWLSLHTKAVPGTLQ